MSLIGNGKISGLVFKIGYLELRNNPYKVLVQLLKRLLIDHSKEEIPL